MAELTERSSPTEGSRNRGLPPETAFRIDVSAAMGIDAGPWTVDPAAEDAAPPIRWHGPGRATVQIEGTGGAGEDVSIAVGGPQRGPRPGVRRREIVVGGWRIVLDLEPERIARLREQASRGRTDAAHAGPLELRAIIPGRIVDVFVAEGDRIEAGHHLMVLEAMKMQNELRSPRGGTVERIAVGQGQTVDLGTLLVVIR